MASASVKNESKVLPEPQGAGLLVTAAKELASLHSELPRSLRANALAKGGEDGLREICFRYGQRAGELRIPQEDALLHLSSELDLWEAVSRDTELDLSDERQLRIEKLTTDVQFERERMPALSEAILEAKALRPAERHRPYRTAFSLIPAAGLMLAEVALGEEVTQTALRLTGNLAWLFPGALLALPLVFKELLEAAAQSRLRAPDPGPEPPGFTEPGFSPIVGEEQKRKKTKRRKRGPFLFYGIYLFILILMVLFFMIPMALMRSEGVMELVLGNGDGAAGSNPYDQAPAGPAGDALPAADETAPRTSMVVFFLLFGWLAPALSGLAFFQGLKSLDLWWDHRGAQKRVVSAEKSFSEAAGRLEKLRHELAEKQAEHAKLKVSKDDGTGKPDGFAVRARHLKEILKASLRNGWASGHATALDRLKEYSPEDMLQLMENQRFHQVLLKTRGPAN